MSNPFKGFADAMSEMTRMREQWTRAGDSSQRQRTSSDAWVPARDVLMEGEDLRILVELPGVRRENIDLTLSGGILVVSGEKAARHVDAEGDAQYYTRERRYGSFRRSMSVAEGLESDRISTRFDGCVLEIAIRGDARVSGPERLEVGDPDHARRAHHRRGGRRPRLPALRGAEDIPAGEIRGGGRRGFFAGGVPPARSRAGGGGSGEGHHPRLRRDEHAAGSGLRRRGGGHPLPAPGGVRAVVRLERCAKGAYRTPAEAKRRETM